MHATRFRGAAWSLLPFLFAPLLFSTTGIPAQEKAPDKAPDKAAFLNATERFPPGTLAVLRIKDIERHKTWLETSPFGDLVKDPEVKPLWEQLTGMAKKFASQAEQGIGVNPLDMLSRIKGEVAIGLTKVKISTPPVPGIMITVDCKNETDAFKKNLESLLELVPEKMYRVATREVKGVSVRTFMPLKSQGRRNPTNFIGPIHLGWIDSVLVLSNDKAGFDKFIRVSCQEDLETLGDTQNWKDTVAKLGGKGDITLYVNVHAVSELIEAAVGIMPSDVGPVISALGLDEFPTIGSSIFLRKDSLYTRSILGYTGDGKSGIGSLITFKKADLSIPRWVPEDAWQVVIVNYDFSAAFSGLCSIIEAAGEEPYEDFQEGLERFNDRIGLSLENDILGALGNPIIMVRTGPAKGELENIFKSGGESIINPMAGQGPILLGVRIKNRETIESLLEYFEGMGAELTEYMGATILSAPTYDENQPVMDLAITDTHVLMGIGTTSIVRQILQRMGGQERGLGSLEGVRDCVEGLPREGEGLVVYNYGKMLSVSLNAMKVMMLLTKRAAMLARFPVPSSEIFEKYFGYAAGVMSFETGVGLIFDLNLRFNRK